MSNGPLFRVDEARLVRAAWQAEQAAGPRVLAAAERLNRPIVLAPRGANILAAAPRSSRLLVKPRVGGVVTARPQP